MTYWAPDREYQICTDTIITISLVFTWHRGVFRYQENKLKTFTSPFNHWTPFVLLPWMDWLQLCVCYSLLAHFWGLQSKKTAQFLRNSPWGTKNDSIHHEVTGTATGMVSMFIWHKQSKCLSANIRKNFISVFLCTTF